ncbi:hypothetical protein V6N13_133876 [Hibiscus sabdariffa]|uniref:Uncharacterized protein n=1 Tax=Hibiscus sabdariffa TaxID=183260 RepID=A0ABR2QZW7_9ROSI
MADVPGYLPNCLQTGKLAVLPVLVSGGIVLQILACALYNNWWPMLTVIMYVLLPMPLMFFAGSDGYSRLSESNNGWMNATKFLTGASAIGSIAIPAILKHAGIIGWGALNFLHFIVKRLREIDESGSLRQGSSTSETGQILATVTSYAVAATDQKRNSFPEHGIEELSESIR